MDKGKRIFKFTLNKKPLTFTVENSIFHSPYSNETTVFYKRNFELYQCGKCGVLFNVFPIDVKENIEYCPLCGARRKKDYAR